MVSDGLFKLPNEFRHFEATEVPPTPLRYRRVVEWFELEETPKDRLFTLPAVHREMTLLGAQDRANPVLFSTCPLSVLCEKIRTCCSL